MDCISNKIFSPWLSLEEQKTVEKHTWKNFTYIRYASNQTGEEYFGRLNKVSREVMWADQPPMVSFKCLLITVLAIPIDFIIRETFYTTRLLITSTQIFFKSIFHFLDNFGNGDVLATFYDDILLRLVGGLIKTIVKEVQNIARVAFYCIGIAFAATGGFCMDPFKARRRIGFMVLKLNQGVTVNEYRHMLRMQKAQDPSFNFLKCLESFYMAECMQPWVLNIDNGEWRIITQSDNYDDVNISKAKECPCAKWAIFPLIPFCV